MSPKVGFSARWMTSVRPISFGSVSFISRIAYATTYARGSNPESARRSLRASRGLRARMGQRARTIGEPLTMGWALIVRSRVDFASSSHRVWAFVAVGLSLSADLLLLLSASSWKLHSTQAT